MERFAFVLHPLHFEDFTRQYPWLRFAPERLVESGFSHLPPFKVSHITGVRSKTGAEAEGWFIVMPVSARLMLKLSFREVLLPKLTFESNRTLGMVSGFLVPYLVRHGMADSVEVHLTADYLARMILSLIGAPGRWDLADPEQVLDLVGAELLAGVVGEPPSPAAD